MNRSEVFFKDNLLQLIILIDENKKDISYKRKDNTFIIAFKNNTLKRLISLRKQALLVEEYNSNGIVNLYEWISKNKSLLGI